MPVAPRRWLVPPAVVLALYVSAAPQAARTAPKLLLSLGPWTSSALRNVQAAADDSTIPYRLAVKADAGQTVQLSANGTPKGWIASFCDGRLCSPNRLQTTVPPSGEKVVKFLLVPPEPTTASPTTLPKVRIDARAGTQTAHATT